jgi:hypothetical protein
MWSRHSCRIDPISHLAKTILPGRGRCSRLVPNAHRAQSARDDRTMDAIPVTNHVARSFIARECFCDLARSPFCGRMRCDADPDQRYAIQSYCDVGLEQIEANGRDNEQVHSGDILSMITLKGAPSLAWQPARCSSAGLAHAAPSRFVAALPIDAISNASSSESRLCANAPASRAE